ncbi:MAG: TetR/AcrR family transcriptional regulator [Pseudomonadota bacterium]
MAAKTSTKDRIVEAGRKLFNAKGYGETSLSQIAAEVGISQGNLTYHFPAKRELALRIQQDAKSSAAAHKRTDLTGSVAEDYIEHLLSGMDLTWQYRFLFRDRAQFIADQMDVDPNAALIADFEELHTLIRRIDKEGLLIEDPSRNLRELTRSLWIVSRYWMNYLSEIEGHEEIIWRDQERGVKQHFAVLAPNLTEKATDAFKAALGQANSTRNKALGG